MPDLNIKGNFIDQFGGHLPTPIIDSISIRNDKLEIALSLFFNFRDAEISEADIDNYLTFLGGKLQVYTVMVWGKEYADALINGDNIDIWTEMYGGQGTAADQKAKFSWVDDYDWHDSIKKNFAVDPFYHSSTGGTTSWSVSNQNFYDAKDSQQIRQYSRTLTIDVDMGGGAAFSIETINDNVFLKSYPLKLQDLTIFAFTSFLDLPETTTSPVVSSTSFRPVGFIEHSQEDEYRSLYTLALDLLPPLKKQQVSNISYERVFANGVPDVEPRPHFIDNEEVIYNKIPIQAINGKFYTQAGVTLKQAKATFQSYVEARKSIGEQSEDAQSILDNISYALETYGTTQHLLIELNKIRETFPDKSTATLVGRMYKDFKDIFFGVDQKAQGGTGLNEKLVKSSKVRDLRSLPESTWTPPSIEERPDSKYFYSYLGDGGYLSALQIWSEADPPAPEAFVKKGFWFFDYEAALRDKCNALSVFPIESLVRVFGEHAVRANYRIVSARVYKHVWASDTSTDPERTGPDDELDSAGTVMTLIATIDYALNSAGTSYGPRNKYTQYANASVDMPGVTYTNDSVAYHTVDIPSLGALENRGGLGTVEESTLEGSATYYSYLMLRGVDALDDPEVNTKKKTTGYGDKYGLLCFEFQDVEKAFDADTDQNIFYTFQVTIEDHTKSLVEAMVSKFREFYDNELTPYYEKALETCSYNNVDGQFNDFFTEGIMGYYSGYDSREYPWVVAPVLLNFQRDLLTDAYGGSDEVLLKEAEAVAANINPINGTLPNLQAFYEAYTEIIDSYYGAGDGIPDRIAAMADDEQREFNSMGYNAMYPVPAPVPLVPSAIVESTPSETASGPPPVYGSPPKSSDGVQEDEPAVFEWVLKSTMPKISFGRKLNNTEKIELEDWMDGKIIDFAQHYPCPDFTAWIGTIGDWVQEKSLVGGSGVHAFNEWFGSLGATPQSGPYNYDIRARSNSLEGGFGNFAVNVWGEENPAERGVDAWVQIKLYRLEQVN